MYDPEIREYLKEYYKDKNFVDEVVLGRSRIDLLEISTELHGYEIKSDHDNHARLKKQRGNYNKFLSRITIVVAESKADAILAHVPHFWGAIIVSKTGDSITLNQIRECSENPYYDKKKIISLLWKDELLNVLSVRHSVNPNGRYSKIPKWRLIDMLQKELTSKESVELVRSCLLNRLNTTDWRL
jgi:hypothetical protein